MAKLSNKEDVIQQFKNVHGDRYDYSLVEYINSAKKVAIICPEHGEFEQTPNSHLNGRGCSKCAYIRKFDTQEKIIEEFKNAHGNKYDYSLVKYTSGKKYVKIICPEHGVFEQFADNHKIGSGCQKCSYDKKRFTKEHVTKQFREVHGDKYDYSLVEYINDNTKIKINCSKHGIFKQTPQNHKNGRGCLGCHKTDLETFIKESNFIHNKFYNYDKVVYNIAAEKVTIVCPIHGDFEQSPASHKIGQGCPTCSNENRKLTTENFIEKSNIVHGNKYDYSKVDYTYNRNPVLIGCPKHGYFFQSPRTHLAGSSCPICRESTGESSIRVFLEKHEIFFEREKMYPDCIDVKKLKFDFYLPDFNICIEYDGIQHFKPVDVFGGREEFLQRQKKDKIKNLYCEDKNINLIRISYLEKDNIESILKNKLDI